MPLTSIVETLGSGPAHEGMMANVALRTRPEITMPPKKAARFPRTARLLRHADFERVYKQGRRHFSASMTVFYWPRTEIDVETRAGAPSTAAQGGSAPHGLRIGFTVGRALGGAVQRNRMKRRLREAVRLTLPSAAIAADVVINPKKSLLSNDFAAIVNEVRSAFVVIEQKLSAKSAEKTRLEANENAESRSPKPDSRP